MTSTRVSHSPRTTKPDDRDNTGLRSSHEVTSAREGQDQQRCTARHGHTYSTVRAKSDGQGPRLKFGSQTKGQRSQIKLPAAPLPALRSVPGLVVSMGSQSPWQGQSLRSFSAHLGSDSSRACPSLISSPDFEGLPLRSAMKNDRVAS